MSRTFTIAGKPYTSPDKIGFGRRQRIQERQIALYRQSHPNEEPYAESSIRTDEGKVLSNYAVWFVYGGAGQNAEYTLSILRGILKPADNSPAIDSSEFEELFLDSTDEEINAVSDFFFGTEGSKTSEPIESNATSTTAESLPDTEGSLKMTPPVESSSAALTLVAV